MMKLKSKKFCRGSFKFGNGGGNVKAGEKGVGHNNTTTITEIKWELRPGGMLVQKRETGSSVGEGMIVVRASTVSQWHDISIEATSTFGELKMILSLVTGLEPREQRVLFKGKEREDDDYLHMVGVGNKDKVVLLQDPAIKEMKKLHRSRSTNQKIPTAYRTISV
ncbi:BAG family molecular chaperone regulator 2-like [Hibiscus syriacus]|uniref:BAG family molecular chaperone regulator 2-like n=1 Tax=Hibiscus syriacus TaxID=106335 RepID=UPI001923C6D9|nr:BAG family molecular chaperone regulator 2-like [Hibiscus syriacus]